jgi:hypothetical protein
LVTQDPVLCDQMLIAQEQFLVNRAGDVGEHSFPIHRSEVNQHWGFGPISRSNCKPLKIQAFERFDPTGFLPRRGSSPRCLKGCTLAAQSFVSLFVSRAPGKGAKTVLMGPSCLDGQVNEVLAVRVVPFGAK